MATIIGDKEQVLADHEEEDGASALLSSRQRCNGLYSELEVRIVVI